MKILVIEPLKKPYVKEIPNTLEAKQEIVGGLIQAIYPFDHPEIALICNDEQIEKYTKRFEALEIYIRR